MQLAVSEPVRNALGSFTPRAQGSLQASAQLASVRDAGRRAVKITNPRSGGDWTTYVTRQPFDANERPVLSWNYRVPEGVGVNLYALVDGKWREVLFTGDPSNKNFRNRFNQRQGANRNGRPRRQGPALSAVPVEFDRSITLGKVEGVLADDKWHTATVDLAALLKGAGLSTRVESLAFAAPDRDYLRAGIGGNRVGATYWLGDFAQSKKLGAVAALPK